MIREKYLRDYNSENLRKDLREFCEVFNNYRKNMNIKSIDIVNKVGCSKFSISEIVNGKLFIANYKILVLIEKYYNLPKGYFILNYYEIFYRNLNMEELVKYAE